MSVGAEIKTRRESRGMRQDELARLVCVSQSMIAQFERGYKLPSLSMLCRIAEALGTSPAEILAAGTKSEGKA